jgi:sulfur-oxidizing protein SoxY
VNRRLFLAGSLTAPQVAWMLGTGLLLPARSPGQWPAHAFQAEGLEEAMAGLTEGAPAPLSDRVSIEAKAIAENGASVPVAITSSVSGARTLLLFSEKNPNPALARFRLSPRIAARLDTRIKMGASGRVVAVVMAGGRAHRAERHIQVTAGGCG